MSDVLLDFQAGGVAVVTLDAPERRNSDAIPRSHDTPSSPSGYSPTQTLKQEQAISSTAPNAVATLRPIVGNLHTLR